MIAEVVKALKAYEALDTTGKTLFRGETGLVRVQQAAGKRRRTMTKDKAAKAGAAVGGPKRKYTRRPKPEQAQPGPGLFPDPAADPVPVAE